MAGFSSPEQGLTGTDTLMMEVADGLGGDSEDPCLGRMDVYVREGVPLGACLCVWGIAFVSVVCKVQR